MRVVSSVDGREWGRRAYEDHERDLRVDPAHVEHEDEEARLRHHARGEDDAGPDFLEPPLGAVVGDVQFDFATRDAASHFVFIVEVVRNGPSVRRAAGLGRDDVDQEEERE